MKSLVVTLTAAAAALFALSTTEASARFQPQAVEAPSLVEQAACTVRRVRTVRPNGRVVIRDIRRCTPDVRRNCRVERQRIVRPNGRVVNRTVRRCR